MDHDVHRADVRFERAELDGILISVLAYGALLMLYIQLLRVLLTRPKRGKVFWAIVAYSGVVITLATIAVGGKIKFAEYVYVSSLFERPLDLTGQSMWVPSFIAKRKASMTVNVMNRICTTLSPWFGDIFMIYRVMVVWNYPWWALLIPLPLYFSHTGMAIPYLIADTHLGSRWELRSDLYGMVFHTLCVVLNIVISVLITVRLLMMRKKLEIALGRLSASFYTSGFTILVESGSFATLWGIIYLALRAQHHWAEDAFLQPYYYIIGMTRMLIVLRMAQNRAWTRDIVTAANTGVMDWEVSSVQSIPFPEGGMGEDSLKHVKSPHSSVADSANTLG